MRILARLLLLPLQLVATLALAAWWLFGVFVWIPAGYVVNGVCPKGDATMTQTEKAMPWIWKPRFVKPKGPTVF